MCVLVYIYLKYSVLHIINNIYKKILIFMILIKLHIINYWHMFCVESIKIIMEKFLFKQRLQISLFIFFNFFIFNNSIYSQLTCSSDTNLVFRIEKGLCNTWLDQSDFASSFPISSCNLKELKSMILLDSNLKPFNKRRLFNTGEYRFYWNITDGCGFLIFCSFKIEVKFPEGITNCAQVIPNSNALNSMCGNGDFESGSILPSEWSGSYGTIGSTPTLGFSSGLINLGTSHQTIVNKGVDPTVNILTVAPHPTPNNFSLRLGNKVTGCGSERISKEFLVTAGNANLAFWYACVFENPVSPPHIGTVQPGLQVNLTLKPSNLDISSLVDLGNGSNFLIANSNDPFFNLGPALAGDNVVYKDWSCVNVDLSKFINQIVEIEFVNKDCSYCGHWGYTYLDNICVGCPSGSVSLVNATCIPGDICVDYSLPVLNGVTGQCRFLLDLFRDGVVVYSDTSAMIFNGNQYCFKVDTCELLNEDFYDYKIKIDCTVPAPPCPLVPPPIQNPIHLPVQYLGVDSFGIKLGLNNDLPTCCIIPSLACDDHIQVSLDSNCCAIITPDMVLEGNYPLNCLKVLLKDKYGNVIPSSPKICNQFIGQLISYSLVDTCTGNSCWGTLVVEDKLPPKITCQNPDTVFCNNTGFNWTPPPGVDNCGGVVKTIVISDVTTKMPCDSFCIAQRKVTYYYQDQYGNRSDTCMKIICYKKINFSDIVWPRDTVFSCEMWDTIPPPSTSGVPMAGGYPIYPDWHLCKMAVTYEDLLIPICPKSFKVLRTWTVIDWCKSSPNNVYKYYQVIKVIDDRGPIVVCSPDLTVSTDIWSCTGTAIIAPPRVIRECSKTTLEVGYKIVDKHGVPTYEGTSKNNIIKLPNGYYSISGLPLGLSWVVFHVTDECGNSTDCYTEVTVADLVPPIAVCDQKTVVSLTIDGTAKIEAITFDDGSLDNCMIDRFEVKRMDDGIPCNTLNGNQWGPYVFFCCADIGKTIMVSLRVWDKAGNSNTCMVEVQVQDKIPPVIFCPPHITVSCEFDYADLSVFGTVVTDVNLRKPIQINDPKVKHSGPLLDGYAYDGCGAVVKELTPIYNLTCNRGTITRTFEATDISGLKSICTQIITIQDLNPNNVTVKWPVDFLSNSNCTSVPKLQPDVTGKPIVSGADKCNQIMITHEDQIFTLEPDACIKILRKWTIIDWCIYQANNPATGGYWTWTQIIKVSNTVAPTFTSSCVDRNIDVYGPGCGGNISLVGTAKDDCTDSADLVWYHSVDLYNDGLSPGIEYLRSGPGADASGTYPVGKHRITYFVKDGCNNETRCSFVITVVDAKKPTPYCNSSITTTIMPSTKAISIWAKDFNINSEDNCTSKENLKYYFLINNIKLPSLNLDCSNIGLNKIRMYVEDEAGNSDYCEVTLDLQDPNKVCGGTFLRASGNMTTPDGKVMPKGKLTAINSNTGSSQESEVQANGNYSFNDLTKGGSYRIKSTYNEDPLNGVSTQDIVLIQKHILGQQILDSPYKYIAADANNSGSISAADISEIRKLILGIIPKFNQNESWRFIPKGYVFQNKNKPFPFEEEIQHQNITTNCLNDDFYAVKIGDINGNVNLFNTAATRALNSYTIEVENKTIPSKENVRIPIYASQDMSIIGIQLALQLSKGLKISAIEPGALPIQSEQYVKNQNDLVLSFANNNAIQVKPGEVLFYVDVINESMEDIYSEVQINSNKLNAEVYDASTNAYTIKMHVRHNSDQETKLQLFQNVPNPFRDKTYIQFLSSSTEEVKIQIIGLDGRLQYEKVVGNSFSIQNIEIDESILSHSGVYLVKLSSRNETASIKIVKFN